MQLGMEIVLDQQQRAGSLGSKLILFDRFMSVAKLHPEHVLRQLSAHRIPPSPELL